MSNNTPAAVSHVPGYAPTEIPRALRRLETVLAGLQRFPLLANGWSLVSTTSVGYGVERVAHGLGRTPVGLLVVSSDGPRPNPGVVAADASFLTLDYGAVAGAVTLLVW